MNRRYVDTRAKLQPSDTSGVVCPHVRARAPRARPPASRRVRDARRAAAEAGRTGAVAVVS